MNREGARCTQKLSKSFLEHSGARPPLVQVTSCSICLEDFGKGQRVRELPKCGHVYHSHCVDRWLRMHNACPLCRIPAL